MGEVYQFRDSLWVLVRKILGWLSEIGGGISGGIVTVGTGVAGIFTILTAAFSSTLNSLFVTLVPGGQVAASNTTVTVSGANIQVLPQQPNRSKVIIQNYGAQSCEITFGNAAGTDGQTLYPVGIMTSGDADLRYTGAIYAKWNGTTTTLKVLVIDKA